MTSIKLATKCSFYGSICSIVVHYLRHYILSVSNIIPTLFRHVFNKWSLIQVLLDK